MTKRILAFLLVLAMVASFVPVMAAGAETDPLQAHTEHDGTWTKWDNGSAMPTAAGNYYLTTDVELTAAWVTSGEITVCLNGHHIRQTAANQRVIDVNGTLSVYDCTAHYEGDTYVSGTITGGSRTYGAGISVKNNAVFNLYSGAVSGNHCTSGDGFGGGIYLSQNKSNTQAGGVFNMYGGEVSGNSAVYGGGVYIPGHNTSNTYTSEPAKVNIYGGKLRDNLATTDGGAICQRFKPAAPVYIENAEISGNSVTNTATGKGCGGAIYVQVGGSLTVKDSVIKENISSNGAIYTQGGAPVVLENVQVIDNEANTSGTAGIYVAGSSSTLTVKGLVVVDGNENNNIYFNNGSAKPLYVDELASGSKLQYNTNSKVNTDDKVDTVIAIAKDGKQEGWTDISVICNDEEVNYTTSGFKFGHYHGDQKYSAWTSSSTLPSNGYNFLTQDVVRTKEAGLAGDSHICLHGHNITIDPGATSTMRMIAVTGKVTIEDCTAHYDESGNYISGKLTGGNRTYGAALAVRQGGTLVLESGAIAGNGNSDEGGAVYINGSNDTKNGGVFIMNGGEIRENTSKRGMITLAASTGTTTQPATFIMNGGKIHSNTATENGGAIYGWAKADVQLLGGQITGNQAAKMAGGVYVHADMGKLTLGGSVIIDGNIASGENKNVYLSGQSVLVLQDLTTGAKIGVYNDGAVRAVTAACAEGSENYIISNLTNRSAQYQEGAVWLAGGGEHKHCLCDSELAHCDHALVNFASWDKADSLPTTAGAYYLTTDVTLTKAQDLSGNVQLCLNGHTIKSGWQEGKDTFRLIGVSAGRTLDLTDCQGGGRLTGGNRDYGSAISVRERAVLNLYAGEISGNSNEIDGTVYIARGTFNMYGGVLENNYSRVGTVCLAEAKDGLVSTANLYGGVIRNNEAVRGGGLYAYDGSAVLIDGVTVEKNHATLYGGGLYLKPDCAFTMVSGKVDNNTAVEMAGGIYAGRSTYAFKGGSVSGNKGGADGGAIYCVAGDILVSGTTFANNVSGGAGGAINLAPNVKGTEVLTGSFTMTGGVFSGNESKNSGGAVYVRVAKADISGGKVTGNKANGNGGGFYFAGTEAVLRNVEISGNTAVKDSGAVGAGQNGFKVGEESRTWQSKVTIQDGAKLNNNKAKYGGAMSVYHETVVLLEGGEVKGNYSENYGGGIIIGNPGSFKMTGGTIAGNTAKKNSGGGLYVAKSRSVIISGGNITGNWCKKYGAGIYLNNCTVNIYGGYIGGNYTDESGSGISSSSKGVVNLYGGTIANNTCKSSAGGILIQSQSRLNMYGGTVRDNKVPSSGGGIYISTNSFLHMEGGKVCGNQAERYGSAMYVYGSVATITGGEFYDNYSVAGGTVYITRSKEYTEVSGIHIHDNKADNSGGGMVFSRANGSLKDAVIENNEAVAGAGLLCQMENTVGENSRVDCENVIIRNNKVTTSGGGLYIFRQCDVTMKNCQITGNTAAENGGGVYMNFGSTLLDYESHLTTDDCKIQGNTAGKQGGGAFINNLMHANFKNSKILDNTASEEGAGIYSAQGSHLTVTDSLISGNQGGKAGAGIYGGYDLNLLGGTVTDNKSAEGAAVYIAPGKYDGHSYTYGKVKLSGNLIIKDNACEADLYIDEGRVCGTTAEGFGEDTELHVTLHSGFITQAILASFDYEGGDLHYIVTYGDKSMTQIEPGMEQFIVKPAEEEKPGKDGGNTILYVGIGILALAAIGGAALVLTKKKKPQESK